MLLLVDGIFLYNNDTIPGVMKWQKKNAVQVRDTLSRGCARARFLVYVGLVYATCAWPRE